MKAVAITMKSSGGDKWLWLAVLGGALLAAAMGSNNNGLRCNYAGCSAPATHRLLNPYTKNPYHFCDKHTKKKMDVGYELVGKIQ